MELLGDTGHVESPFGPFIDSLSVDARFVHGLRQTYHRLRKSFWTHLMVLLGDEAQVDARFGLFGDSANLDARLVQVLHRMYPGPENHFGRTRWNSKVTRLKWNLVAVHLEIVLVLVQDRCTVCSKQGSEIILTAPDRTPR